eukprot:704509-Amphidinium_carterae.1
MRVGVHTAWTDGSGKHSSNPRFRRCGVGYVTDTGCRSLAVGNRSSELNSWPLSGIGKSASPKGSLVTVKVW